MTTASVNSKDLNPVKHHWASDSFNCNKARAITGALISNSSIINYLNLSRIKELCIKILANKGNRISVIALEPREVYCKMTPCWREKVGLFCVCIRFISWSMI